MKSPRVLVVVNNRIERGIRPPMGTAITLPLLVDGAHGYCLYVTYNPFDAVQPSDAAMRGVAGQIAKALVCVKAD